MQTEFERPPWDLTHVIGLLHTLSPPQDGQNGTATTYQLSIPSPQHEAVPRANESTELGDFKNIFEYLKSSTPKDTASAHGEQNGSGDWHLLGRSLDQEKGVRWRDEVDSAADLEDNVEPSIDAANSRTKDRAARRAKAKRKKTEFAGEEAGIERPPVETDTASGNESDGKTPISPTQLASRRRAIIQQQTTPNKSTETQKIAGLHVTKHDWPVAEPFLYKTATPKPSQRSILPLDNLSAPARRQTMIHKLQTAFPHERKYLQHTTLITPSLSTRNVDESGIHVFVDISNILIGFHEQLKSNRNLPPDQKVHRIPFNFPNFSLVLERGRPAAKRVLVGSDNFPHIERARDLGYETNILERVHKAKALKPSTPSRHHHHHGNKNSHYHTSTGNTSGSDTAPGPFPSTAVALGPAKWVEQAVDEILHLKILESVVDSETPGGTMVLATGDAAIAEYSAGFLRMVERALKKGWTVELVSFSKGLSGLYRRGEFKRTWGPKFGIVELDGWAEWFLDVEELLNRSSR